MATKAKAALVSQRFHHSLNRDDVYAELRHQLQAVRPLEERAKWEHLILDLRASRIDICAKGCIALCLCAPALSYKLTSHAQSQLTKRLGFGNAPEILSPDLYNAVEAEYQAHIRKKPGEFIIKHREGLALAILTDGYKEPAYDEVVTFLETHSLSPVRLVMNDQFLKIQAIESSGVVCSDWPEVVIIGLQVRSSDVGGFSRQSDLFLYIEGQTSGILFKGGCELSELPLAQRGRALAELSLSQEKRLEVVAFLGSNKSISKRAMDLLLEPLVKCQTAWDVVKLLSAQGTNGEHAPSLQMAMEEAAGDLFMWEGFTDGD